MKFVGALCAVLVSIGGAPVSAAPLRAHAAAGPFAEAAPRPPRAIPNVRPPGHLAVAPMPRPKPDGAPVPPATTASGAPVFPPVAPLE
jgi:hypothetical protein